MAALEPFMSLTRFGERVTSHYHGADFALIDEPTDLGELSGIGLGSVTETVRPMLHRLFFRGLPERRDEKGTRLQYRPGPLLRFSPDEVQDQINIARDLLEAPRL